MSRPVKPSDYSLLESFLDDPKTMRMRQSDKTSFHLAMIVRRGKIIEVASNRLGSRSRGSGFSANTIHAERNVIKQLGDVNQIRGCDLFVMRIHYNSITGERSFGNSRPCWECQIFIEKCFRCYGLRNVYYTSDPDETYHRCDGGESCVACSSSLPKPHHHHHLHS